jgi:hypothetical protein
VRGGELRVGRRRRLALGPPERARGVEDRRDARGPLGVPAAARERERRRVRDEQAV